MARWLRGWFLVLALEGAGAAASAAPYTIAPIQDSEITFRVTPIGAMPIANSTSPFAVGSSLVLVDQGGYLYRRDAFGITSSLLSAAERPAGLTLVGERILNAAATPDGGTIYVTFTSSTLPTGIPLSVSPRGNDDAFQVVYSYDFDGVTLSSARALRAFEVYRDGHTGGGMVVSQDGSLLLAMGDNGDAGEDGRSFAQDGSSHLSKIVRLDPVSGSVTVLAKGLRNPQRLAISVTEGIEYLSFVDIGGSISEELNAVRLDDILDPTAIENFGWGRSSLDGRAREGTFYINAGGGYVSDAPPDEAGFIQPVAQWGREGASFFAGSGPAACGNMSVGFLFGDLQSGSVYATTQGPPGSPLADVLRVNLVDQALAPTSLAMLAGGRPDPRFFCFGDGSTGVLLERSGEYFRLDELTNAAPVPEPASLWLLLGAVPALGGRLLRQRVQKKRAAMHAPRPSL